MNERWWHRAVAHAGVNVVLTVTLTTAWACESDDRCYERECEPCVGESCRRSCEASGDEDEVVYNCPVSCSGGADCNVRCLGRSECYVDCDGSRCTSDHNGWAAADCTNGAECEPEQVGSIYCEASRCDVHFYYGYGAQVCVEGSTCTTVCGEPPSSGETICAMTCDRTSSCHLRAKTRAALCCDDSLDCALECPTGATTCEDGTLVCGLPCDATRLSGFCPAFDSAIDGA